MIACLKALNSIHIKAGNFLDNLYRQALCQYIIAFRMTSSRLLPSFSYSLTFPMNAQYPFSVLHFRTIPSFLPRLMFITLAFSSREGFPADFEGNIVYPIHKKHIFMRKRQSLCLPIHVLFHPVSAW